MLDKECCTVHRCGTLVLGVFLEKDKLLPLSPVITHYDTHIHWWVVRTHAHRHTHTCTLHRNICKGEKKIKCADAVRKVKICKWTRCPRISSVIHSIAHIAAQVTNFECVCVCVCVCVFMQAYITPCLFSYLFVLVWMSKIVNAGVHGGNRWVFVRSSLCGTELQWN